jgi:hypothetical protein
VDRIPGNSAGAMDGDGSRKFLLHTTEGTSIAGATAAYVANNSWPHFTVDCKRRQVVQHLDTSVAARSLRNEAGGVQTNKDGNVCVQVEMVGGAATPSSIGLPSDLAWFGRTVVGPVCRAHGIPLVSTVRWVAYPASFGTGATQRLSPAVWDSYNGLLGHQHAPENSHGDPGLIDIALILAAATEEDDMTPAESAKLNDIDLRVEQMYRAFRATNQQEGWSGNLPGRVDWLYDNRASLQTDEAAIAQQTAALIIAALPAAPGIDEAALAALVETAVRKVFADAGQP